MKLRWRWLCLSLLLPVLFAAAKAEPADVLPAESFGGTPDPRWRIECIAENDAAFDLPLKRYPFHREQGAHMLEAVNARLQQAFGEGFSLRSGADLDMPTWLYSGRAPYSNLALPSFMPRRASLSPQQLSVVETCCQILREAGWHPADTPYVQSTLEELYQRGYLAAMGRLQTREEYLRALAQHEGVAPLKGTETVVIIAAEVDGYPVVPTLLGNCAEKDAPMYARLLLDENELLYLDMGCGYVAEAGDTVDDVPLACEEAVKIAARHGYQQWQAAWAAMAAESAGGFDYPQFWKDYDPHFVFRVLRAVPSYYAKNNVLSPGWQVDCQVEILLNHDETLTDEARHAYVPESITVTYIVDAFTGEATSV